VKLDKAEITAGRRFAALLPLTEARQRAGRDNGSLADLVNVGETLRGRPAIAKKP